MTQQEKKTNSTCCYFVCARIR